jgi:hypothetical protein
LKEKDQILKTSKERAPPSLEKEKVKKSEKAASPGEASSGPSLKEKDQILNRASYAIVEQPMDELSLFNLADFAGGQRFLHRPHLLLVAGGNGLEPAVPGHVDPPNNVLPSVHSFLRIFVVKLHFLNIMDI